MPVCFHRNYSPFTFHPIGRAGGCTHFVFYLNKKSGNSLLAFCPYRGSVGESPPRTTDSSGMCHSASLEVRLMRIKNLSARRRFLPTASKFPHNVWSAILPLLSTSLTPSPKGKAFFINSFNFCRVIYLYK